MVRSNNLIFLFAGIFLATFSACKKENKLERTIRNELASGVRNDSLFLGLKFGIGMQGFYEHCRALNRQGLVKEGPQNMSVEYIIEDSVNNQIAFNFYAHKSVDGLVHQYNTSFSYSAWVLNRRLHSDRLMEMLPSILMDWYGGNEPFAMVKEGKKHLYKIDGNRMIDLIIYDEGTVVATYTDLSQLGNPVMEQ